MCGKPFHANENNPGASASPCKAKWWRSPWRLALEGLLGWVHTFNIQEDVSQNSINLNSLVITE